MYAQHDLKKINNNTVLSNYFYRFFRKKPKYCNA